MHTFSPYDPVARSTWLEIDLGQFQKNFALIRSEAKIPVLAVIKANAYGHGLAACAHALKDQGVRMFGVATMAEAILLRQSGITTDILMVASYGVDEIETLVAHDIRLSLWDPAQLAPAAQAAQATGKKVIVHLKIDTGMGRIGVLPSQIPAFINAFQAHPMIEVEGVMSHFHTADGDTLDSAHDQMRVFETALVTLKSAGIDPTLRHHANSPGLLRLESPLWTMARAGIILYGQPYEVGFDLPDGIKPVLTWKARLTSVKTLPPGHVVSYGAQYVTQGVETIGVIPVGYADGFRRVPAGVNRVLYKGREVPVVGRVCMDQCMIRLPDDLTAAIGDDVTLIGSDSGAERSAMDVAAAWGTNNYDVVASIATRVPRIYRGLNKYSHLNSETNDSFCNEDPKDRRSL